MYLYNWQSTIILCQEIHVECGLKNPLEISSTSFFWCQHSTVQCSQELGCHRTELSALNCQHRLWETKSPNKYNTDHWFTCDWKQLINSIIMKGCFQGRTILGSTSFAFQLDSSLRDSLGGRPSWQNHARIWGWYFRLVWFQKWTRECCWWTRHRKLLPPPPSTVHETT